ncbi:MAG: hypothetical protein BWK76_24530 [Desulfobulbaceae bacterium A2]|nr:MAG: hypothetical protein BWK76_24530 [Desulfobulbaceae bacterium A2]
MAVEHTFSVVVVSYNDYDATTGPCLESLRAETAPCEIIVVDNASTDDTPDKLRRAAEHDPRLRLRLNHDNRGYAGGNNDGVALASHDVVVLLNSDTVIPPGGLGRLAALLTRHESWDMLGPLTNNCGNEQQIAVSGGDREAILAEGAAWCREDLACHFDTDMLGFFCVALHTELYRRLGGLDEIFGRGFCEDTDFCARARAAGARLLVSEEVFVYHRGSASFGRLGRESSELLKKNRRLFRDRHGAWPEGLHTRWKNLAVLERYGELLPAGDGPVLRHRVANRLRRAEDLAPLNLITRFTYRRRLARLRRALTAGLSL